MREFLKDGQKQVVIDPGEYVVSREPVILSTLLGSCVSACLYDPVNGVVGMNHFLLAENRNLNKESLLQSEAGRYGINAMELLINAMMKQGAVRKNLRAKAFGGGDVLGYFRNGQESYYTIGAVNINFVRGFLKNESIPLDAEDMGGEHGRQIYFRSRDFAVFVRNIGLTVEERVKQEEREYLKKSAQAQAAKYTKQEIW